MPSKLCGVAKLAVGLYRVSTAKQGHSGSARRSGMRTGWRYRWNGCG